jgi:hypothetical protein
MSTTNPAGKITRFPGTRASFGSLLIGGSLCLVGGLLCAGSPGLVEAGVSVALVGLGLLMFLPMVVRRVRLEPEGVVVDRLLWRRSYRYAEIEDVAVYAYGYGRAQEQVYLQLGPRKKRGLGMLSGDAQAIAELVRAAVERGRAHDASSPAPIALSRKLGYAAATALAALAVLGTLGALAHSSTRIDEARLLGRDLVLESVELRHSGKRVDVNVHTADGRVLESATGAVIDQVALAVALTRDRSTPFRAIADAATWQAPWKTGSGLTIVHIYGLERGDEHFLTVADSVANREQARDLMWGLLALPLLGLVLILVGILR